MQRLGLLLAGMALAVSARAVDLAALWDFSRPDLSEQRFRAALQTATGDDALILRTQIARTWGLRRDFARARELLAGLEPSMRQAGAEARARFALEVGRTHSSAAHSPESQDDATRALARAAYWRAFDAAKSGGLDGLAVDALHMMAFVDTAPADQLKWGREALAVVDASVQPAAKRWEASIRNNIGYALLQLDRGDEALDHFRQALALRERGGNAGSIRSARWMVARALRATGRFDEALDIQLRLEREHAAAAEPEASVFDELERLYRVRGDDERARHYERLRAGLVR